MFRDIKLLVTSGNGTVGHDEHPPADVGYGEIVAPAQSVIPSRPRHASVKNGGSPTATCDSGVLVSANTARTAPLVGVGHVFSDNNTAPRIDMALAAEGAAVARGIAEAARIMRAARHRDLLAAVEEWRRASGADRSYWRQDALWRLREWRRLYVGWRAAA